MSLRCSADVLSSVVGHKDARIWYRKKQNVLPELCTRLSYSAVGRMVRELADVAVRLFQKSTNGPSVVCGAAVEKLD